MRKDFRIHHSLFAHLGGFLLVLWLIPFYVSVWVALFATLLFGMNMGDIRQNTTLSEIWSQVFTWQFYTDFLMNFYPIGILVWLVAGGIAALLRSCYKRRTLLLEMVALAWLTGFVILTSISDGLGDITSVLLKSVVALLSIPVFGLALKISDSLPRMVSSLQENTVESILNQLVHVLRSRK